MPRDNLTSNNSSSNANNHLSQAGDDSQQEMPLLTLPAPARQNHVACAGGVRRSQHRAMGTGARAFSHNDDDDGDQVSFPTHRSYRSQSALQYDPQDGDSSFNSPEPQIRLPDMVMDALAENGQRPIIHFGLGRESLTQVDIRQAFLATNNMSYETLDELFSSLIFSILNREAPDFGRYPAAMRPFMNQLHRRTERYVTGKLNLNALSRLEQTDIYNRIAFIALRSAIPLARECGLPIYFDLTALDMTAAVTNGMSYRSLLLREMHYLFRADPNSIPHIQFYCDGMRQQHTDVFTDQQLWQSSTRTLITLRGRDDPADTGGEQVTFRQRNLPRAETRLANHDSNGNGQRSPSPGPRCPTPPRFPALGEDESNAFASRATGGGGAAASNFAGAAINWGSRANHAQAGAAAGRLANTRRRRQRRY